MFGKESSRTFDLRNFFNLQWSKWLREIAFGDLLYDAADGFPLVFRHGCVLSAEYRLLGFQAVVRFFKTAKENQRLEFHYRRELRFPFACRVWHFEMDT